MAPWPVIGAPSDAVTRHARDNDLKEDGRIASATKMHTIRVTKNSRFSRNREEEDKGENEVA
jgi:hypothetical protein